MKLAITLATVVSLSGAIVGSAYADNKAKADALFKEGKKLMGDKRYADACAAFEESYKLDPGIGAELNVAKCYEEWGKLGHAYTAYQQAEKLARDAKDSRADQIKGLITELDPQVPRLTVHVPKNAPKNFVVTMDGRPITVLEEAFVVDPGPKTLEWSVGSGPKKQKIVAIERGGESEVTLDIPKGSVLEGEGEGEGEGDKTSDKGKDHKKGAAKSGSGEAPPGRNQRIGGIALGGAGVLAIGVSSVMALSARSKYKDALHMYCNDMTNSCNDQGLSETHDARSSANIATVVFLVGAAAVGGGVALYLLSPKDDDDDDGGGEEEARRYLVPSVSPSGVGLVFGGRY